MASTLIVGVPIVLAAAILVAGMFAIAQYEAGKRKPVALSIATVHEGLAEPPRWDESAWPSLDSWWGGMQTGAYPMVMQLKDGPDPLELEIVPGRELDEFPNLREHMSREQLVTAPKPARARFTDKVFVVELSAAGVRGELVAA